MKDMSIVTSTRRIPQLGEVAILKQRKITILNDIELYGKAISNARFAEMCNELAEVENALAWFGGVDMALEGYETPMQIRASLDL